MTYLSLDTVHCGRSEELLKQVEPGSVSLSFWSPPYFVGKEYERDETLESWQATLQAVIESHVAILKPGAFLVINIADILAFKDPKMPRIQGANVANHRSPVTREMVLEAKRQHPHYSRYQLAALLNCSEQTIDRRLNGNNIRGGKYEVQTRVKLVGGILEAFAYDVGLYLYDKRIWKKDPAWANSRWTTNTLKSVSETEDLYVFWKPGEYEVRRDRLSPEEWRAWGYRQVWEIDSVRRNDAHPAMFPEELAYRVVKLYTDPGDIVIDPFLGSGTTAVAAIKLDRRFIGIEKDPRYVEVANMRIAEAAQQPRIFPQGQLEY